MSTPSLKRKADQKEEKGVSANKKLKPTKEATKPPAAGRGSITHTPKSTPQRTNTKKPPSVKLPEDQELPSDEEDSQEVIVTADVHVGPADQAEGSSETTRSDAPKSPQQLILDRLEHMEKSWDTKMKNLNQSLTTTIQESIQAAIAAEVDKVRVELKSEINDLKDRLITLENKPDPVITDTPETTNIVVMGLAQGQNENIRNKVNAVLREGLKLKDVSVLSGERKKSRTEGKPGVVIAKCKNKAEWEMIMKNKSKLNESRQYKSVRIERYKTGEQLRHESDLRLLLQNSSAKDKLQIRGGHLVSKRPPQARENAS